MLVIGMAFLSLSLLRIRLIALRVLDCETKE
jgi:hypothetical protein